MIGRSAASSRCCSIEAPTSMPFMAPGLGSASGYAPENLQPIDLALWGGPGNVRPSRMAHAARRRASGCVSRRAGPADACRRRDRAAAARARRRARSDRCRRARRPRSRRRDPRRRPARIRETRPNGRRPLSAAVEFGHERIARLLLERGADPDLARRGRFAERSGPARGRARRRSADGRAAAGARRRSERLRRLGRQRDVRRARRPSCARC